ncbi:PAF acetylhydrolase family protein [Zopfia rhizophila CBS 207.26]|uniref:1-alkyl-2-acetylglycerophosphocholine esterase n=1 Tax=Zopfia rhizophila CBS 207.26 TaxID=1314779 RepID=A0A6A6DEW5_9PEZI|nr:PAF acetylhydrolase family protein [Zopfia rhizophila CBS 207.26]
MALRATLLLAFLGLSPSPVVSIAVLPVVGSHRFDVATTSASLTDSGRLDPFANDGRVRSIMVSGFYPVPACHHERLKPYMPPATTTFQDDKFAAYGLPNGSFQSLYLETCNGSANRSLCSSSSLPLVLFSGALGTSRLLYNSMLQSVAAAGYLVISIDHPYDADIVEFPNGTIITGAEISSDAEVKLALTTRTEDIAFLHRQIANASITDKLFPGHLHGHRVPKTAIVGHSLGGAAAAATMLQVPSIRGGLNLDGTMFGPVLTAGLDRPFMLMGHENKTQETDPSWKAIWPQLRGWKKEFEVRGTAHYSFSDLPLITSVLDLQNKLQPEIEQVLGTVEGRRMMKLTVTYVTAFLDMVLKSGSEVMLIGGNGEFPEVAEVA